MEYLTWDASLETGINVIDAQHQQIVDYINLLHTATITKDKSLSHEALDSVMNYTLSHFSFEEEMMKVAGYLHYEAHCKVHQSFSAKIAEYRNRLSNGEHIEKLLLSDLRIWLTNHIKNEDADYAKSVNIYLHGDNDLSWFGKRFLSLFKKK